MKICILGRADYILLQRRAQAMARAGHDVHIVTLHNAKVSGVHVHHIKSKFRSSLGYLAALPTVIARINQIAPDVVDGHGISTYGLYTLFIKHKSVMTIYGPDLYQTVTNSKLFLTVVRRAFEKTDLIFGSTELIKEFVAKAFKVRYDHKIIVKSWGIEFERITAEATDRRSATRRKYNVPEDSKVILHARRFHPFWRVEEMINAMPAVLQTYPDAELWFVYPELSVEEHYFHSSMQKLVIDLGIEGNIKLLGGFDYDEFISVLHGSDIFLCVGRNDLLASTLIEAMACGLVPVLGDLPAYHECIENGYNGFLIKGQIDPESISRKILRVLELIPDKSNSIVQINKALVAREYSENECVLWMIDQFGTLVEPPKHLKLIE